MPRDPWDFHDCPIFELTITRWDGHGTTPKEVYRGHTMALTWAEAARLFAWRLLRRATGRLRPSRLQSEEEESDAGSPVRPSRAARQTTSPRQARAAVPAAAAPARIASRDATQGRTTPRHAGGGDGR